MDSELQPFDKVFIQQVGKEIRLLANTSGGSHLTYTTDHNK